MLFEYDINDRLERERFYAPGASELLAVDDLDFVGTSATPSNPQTIWTLHDHQGSVVGLYVSGQPVQRLTYDAFGRTNKGGRFSQDETLFDAVSAGYLGMDFDFQTLLYLDGGRFYDAAGGRYLTPGSMALGTIGIYAFANNTPVDRSNAVVASSSFNSSVASASSVYAAAFFEEASVSNQWNQGNYGKAILYGTGQLMAAVGTAGLGAIAGGIALGGTTGAYAIGTGGAVAGASSGMISTALSSNGQADFSEYMLAGGVGGFFGGLNGVGSMVGLGTGLAGAGIGARYGNASSGFPIGDMAGGIASGGIDDYARALGKGASRMGALRHAAARVGVEGGFTVGGGVAGYAATGTMDGALAGASFGQMLGGAIGNLTVACFAAGTPLVVDFEGNSRSIEDIEVGDYVLARSEFDAAGPLELKRVEEKFVRVAPVMELVVRGQVITTTAEHPFYVAGQERFVPAGELTLEDQLVDSQGGTIAIDAIRPTDRLITVYNLRVADFHTYFVGGKLWQLDAWVHNAGEIAYVRGVKARSSATVAELGLSERAARGRLDSALSGIPGDQKAAHHLLPLAAITDPRTADVVAAAARGGFSMNGANNGVLLSELFHRGGHKHAIKRMIGKAAQLKGSDTEIARDLQSLVDTERNLLTKVEAARLAAQQAGTRGRIHIR